MSLEMKADLHRICSAKVLVIGDVMLDRYLWGKVQRISPEAPVPIVKLSRSSEMLGGAGNVAANLDGLNSAVCLMGIVGSDIPGMQIVAILQEINIQNKIIVDDSRCTTTKTRVIGHDQQLLRIDEDNTQLLPEDVQGKLLLFVEQEISQYGAVILSDYGKGIFQSQGFTERLISLCARNRVPVLVDPKGKEWGRYHGATCVTPNTSELELVAERSIGDDENILIEEARKTLKKYNFTGCLVTRGAKGMCLVESEGQHYLIPSKASEVYDVTGAGDTVIATLGAALASGFSLYEATKIANAAAGIVIRKLGTQPVLFSELSAAWLKKEPGEPLPGFSKLAVFEDAVARIDKWKQANRKIVFTNGCFDLLHSGHVKLLQQARLLGDKVVVGLNTDDSIRRLKGQGRPVLGEKERAVILGALENVDMVVLFDDDTPLRLIEAFRPDFLVKGGDYTLEQVVGAEQVKVWGGQVVIIPLVKGRGSSDIIGSIQSSPGNSCHDKRQENN